MRRYFGGKENRFKLQGWGFIILIIMLVVSGLNFWACTSIKVAGVRTDSSIDTTRLTNVEKTQLLEVKRLQTVLGEQVWPGFSQAMIPIILFNERYEFLTGMGKAPRPWQIIVGDSFLGKPCFRRAAKDPQAFAVAIDSQWAGSFYTLEVMKQKIPLPIGTGFHIIGLLHEMFHAFQAGKAPSRFKEALDVYRFEKHYPFNSASFAAAWVDEGALLVKAMAAKSDDDIRLLTQQFLQLRDRRRQQMGLDKELIYYEQSLEWLEGLAKYVEMSFCQLASVQPGAPAGINYQPSLYFLQNDFWTRLGSMMGSQEGDLRFYLSGMAQAILLDKLKPDWKEQVWNDGFSMEEMLRLEVIKGYGF